MRPKGCPACSCWGLRACCCKLPARLPACLCNGPCLAAHSAGQSCSGPCAATAQRALMRAALPVAITAPPGRRTVDRVKKEKLKT